MDELMQIARDNDKPIEQTQLRFTKSMRNADSAVAKTVDSFSDSRQLPMPE